MNDVERTNIYLAKKKAEKEEQERAKQELLEQQMERQRIEEIANDEKAPEWYRNKYIEKLNAIKNQERETQEEEDRKVAAKLETQEYLKQLREKKLANAKRLMEKYGKR